MKSSPAFTLVEILIVIAIFAIVTIPGFFVLTKSRANQELVATAEQVSDFAKRAHIFSQQYKDEKKWGIQSSDTTSYELITELTNTTYEIIETKQLPQSVTFQSPFMIWFENNTGGPLETQTIVLENTNGIAYEITISPTGVVDTNPQPL